MNKIIFNADKSGSFNANIAAIGPNQIRIILEKSGIIPDDRIIYSGFVVVNEYNGIVEADYSDYIYKYRDVEEPCVYDLDNDGIPYTVEIVPTDPGEETIHYEEESKEPVDITYNKEQINNILDSKIEELSEDCRNAIEFGSDVMINNTRKHFSYSLEKGDQNNIDDLLTAILQTGAGQYYHADGETQEYFEPYQIFDIYSAVKLNKLNKIARYNQLVLMLKDMFKEDKEYTTEDSDYIDQVEFTKTKLKGDFQKAYVANRTQNEDQMEAIKQKLIASGVEFPPEEKEAENATE